MGPIKPARALGGCKRIESPLRERYIDQRGDLPINSLERDYRHYANILKLAIQN
jgi:hypothetical protein